jgi:ABC-type cobalamin/Fe3+-siderophores transport system ATPase subunit
MDDGGNQSLVVGVVGPCGAGKSTLIAGLASHGVQGRHIAQEHSYVQHMWRHMVHPDLLIYLGASFATCTRRRRLNWLQADYDEQLSRLEHARKHADLVIETDEIPAEAVLEQAIAFLRDRGAMVSPPH